MASRSRTLLEPGHEEEWARLNAEKRRRLTPPPETPIAELLRRGQHLSAQAAGLLRAVERAGERTRSSARRRRRRDGRRGRPLRRCRRIRGDRESVHPSDRGLPPLDYETVEERAMRADYGGVEFLVAGLRSIVAFKRLSDRPIGRNDLIALAEIHGDLPIDPIPGLDL